MAKTHPTFKTQAEAAQAAGSDLLDLWHRFHALIISHNAEYGDAGDDPKPAYINEDSAGNIDGTTLSRSQYMDLINFMNQIESLMTNVAPTTGFYRDTVTAAVT